MLGYCGRIPLTIVLTFENPLYVSESELTIV